MKLRKLLSLLLVVAALLSLPCFAFADGVPNVMIGNNGGNYNSSAASDGRSRIIATGDSGKITMPNASSYYSTPQVMYISVSGKNSGYAYQKPDGDRKNLMNYPYHGIKVLAVAEQNGYVCIIYYDNNNKQHAAWVDPAILSYVYPGTVQRIGTPSRSTAANIGDTPVSWSNVSFVGTHQKYTLLSSPAYNCVQFTLDYQVIGRNGAKTNEVLGPRSVYINDGTGWSYVGQFDYPEIDAAHVTVNLSTPTDVLAVATVASCAKPDTFIFRQSVLDVMFA